MKALVNVPPVRAPRGIQNIHGDDATYLWSRIEGFRVRTGTSLRNGVNSANTGRSWIRGNAASTNNTLWAPLRSQGGGQFIEATLGATATSGTCDNALVVGGHVAGGNDPYLYMNGAAVTIWSSFIYLQQIAGSAWTSNQANTASLGYNHAVGTRLRVELRGHRLRVFLNSIFKVEWLLTSYTWTNGVPSSQKGCWIGIYNYQSSAGWADIRYGVLDAGADVYSGSAGGGGDTQPYARKVRQTDGPMEVSPPMSFMYQQLYDTPSVAWTVA